jgi:mannose-6-phosphate isomerase-like protein (cupin superfamily)
MLSITGRLAVVGGVTLVCLSSALLFAQRRGGGPPEAVSYAPKPKKLTAYEPPHKPHTKLAEVKAKHKGQKEWSEWVVKDDYLWGQYIQSAPGSKLPPRFHPDTRTWWVVLEGQMRVSIEGQDSFIARRRSVVQVPGQTIYSMETIGDEPAIRFHVSIPNAQTLYPEKPSVSPPGIDFIPVRLGRRPFEWGHDNKPHWNLDEFAAAKPDFQGTHRVVWDDRGVANAIYGYNSKLPPLNEKDKGHYHPECAEFWVILLGQIRYPVEGQGVIIATEGDVVYVPKFTFHAPRWWGDGPSCRLAMNGYPNIAHLREAMEPH